MKQLTPIQAAILEFVRLFLKEKGYPPTRQEIADGFEFSSCNAAQCHLKALEKKGRISLAIGKVSRGISILRRN